MVAGAMMGLRSIRARAAPRYRLKLATDMTDRHPLNSRLQQAAEQISNESDGQLRIDVFPNDQLGGAMDMLSQLRSGGLEMLCLSGPILESLIPSLGIYGLAFAFKTDTDAWAAMDGELGDYLRTQIRAAGLDVYDKGWANGYRQVFSGSKPIRTPDDMKGFNIRVPSSAIELTTFKDLGAAPTPLNWGEVYSALQTKVVDGVEVPLLVGDFAKLYEVQKYVSITNHMWDSFFLLMNRRSAQVLPAELRTMMATRFNNTALLQRADLRDQDQIARANLQRHGMQINETDPEQFRAVLRKAGYYANFQKTYGKQAWALLEKYAGPLA